MDADLPVLRVRPEDSRKRDRGEPPCDLLLRPETPFDPGHAGVDGDDVGSVEGERLDGREDESVAIGRQLAFDVNGEQTACP